MCGVIVVFLVVYVIYSCPAYMCSYFDVYLLTLFMCLIYFACVFKHVV